MINIALPEDGDSPARRLMCRIKGVYNGVHQKIIGKMSYAGYYDCLLVLSDNRLHDISNATDRKHSSLQ